MLIEEIQDVSKIGEELINVEFKTSTADLQGACETICGFLNNKGGKVFIGIKNNGVKVGQMVTDRTRQEISNRIKKFEPPSDIDISYISMEDSKFIIVMTVDAGPHAPYVFDGRPYQRIESTTSIMPQHLYEQLLVERGHLNYSWESFAANNLDRFILDEEEISKTIKHGINIKRIPENAVHDSFNDILLRFELLEKQQLKNAAIVLFSKSIPIEYAQCTIKLSRFDGINVTNNFIDNQQVRGNVFRLLDEASDFIRRHMSIAGFYQPDSFIRLDKPTLPVLAVREALINAICHRDYQTSAAITMAIFDDRLEIWNPGALPKELRIEDLNKFHESKPRNKLIANVFYSRGMIEMWGTGTIKIFEGCREHGIPDPIFSEVSGGVLITFMYEKPMTKVKSANQNVGHLARRQQKIISLLEKSLELTALEIFEQLGESMSERTLRRDLAELRSLGLIDSRGRSINAIWFKVVR